MAHRFSWALFKLNNLSNWCPYVTFDSLNIAGVFNLNSGIRARVRCSRTKDVIRGSLTGLKIV
jgi:hypothetical protein